MNLCRPCGLDFYTLAGFDEHHVGDWDYTMSEGLQFDPPVYDGWRCLSVHELEAAGWSLDKAGRWRRPAGEPVLARVEL